MSVPAILSMTVQALYNIVDSYFVSQISEKALTAVSLVFPMQSLLIGVGVGTAVGLNSLISRRLGEKHQEEADSAATHGIILGIFNWILFFLIGLFFSRPFIQCFSSDAALVKMGTQYMSIVCMASLGVFIEINIEKILQATGNMIYPMVFQLIGAVSNIILDPLFIFGLIGFPKMGVAGAAAATVIAQTLSMAVALTVLFTKDHAVTIQFHGFRLNPRTIRNIYSVGFPSIIMQSIGSVMAVGMNAILIAFTPTAVAVFGVYFKLQSFVFMPVFGLMQGVMPILGYNFGARKRSRLMKAVTISTVTALAIMTAGTVVFLAVPDRLLRIFNATQNMLDIGIPALKTICLSFIPAAVGISFSNVFQAIGHGFSSLLISVLRQMVVLLPVSFFLARFGLSYVWCAFPLAETVSLIASVFIFIHLYRTCIKNL
jgi:putative MATE family efflux protein